MFDLRALQGTMPDVHRYTGNVHRTKAENRGRENRFKELEAGSKGLKYKL
jgi:hypothetical protein